MPRGSGRHPGHLCALLVPMAQADLAPVHRFTVARPNERRDVLPHACRGEDHDCLMWQTAGPGARGILHRLFLSTVEPMRLRS